MKRNIVLRLIPTLLLAGILTLASNVSSTTASLPVPPLTPAFEYDDGLTRPDILDDLSEGSPPGYGDTSEYLIGDVAVGVIFLESNGSVNEPSTEDWTSTEESEVISEITAGLSWLASQNPDAGVSFTLDIHYRVPIPCEPINYPSGHQEHWIMEAMIYLGYPPIPYSYHRQVGNYINALRNALGTDWAYAMFIVDSSNDPDGKFTDGKAAYAYLGGSFLVMTYDNDGYGIGNMDFVTAHETCHIFYATDEYDGQTETSGYLGVQDHEGSGCMMDRAFSWWLCQASKEQLGWRDTDDDGIQDIVDTFPDTVLTYIYIADNILTYTGSVVEIPYPNNNPLGERDITINTITNVEFRVDFSSWISATPTDAAFDEGEENFTFTTPPLSEGTHTIDTRGINSVGNIEISYASDEVTIMANYYEVELMKSTDLPKLEAEVDIVVEENVRSTPRYGTEFEAWHNGVWESPYYKPADMTLVDRFIVGCTEEKAIALSTYAWIEWTAPALPGTIYDGKIILGVRAAFFAVPTSGVEPLMVNFTDISASYDEMTAWEWDFNDDGTVDSTEQNPTYVYEQEGLYTVSLTVYDANRDNDTETKIDYIDVNQPPVADANGPYTGTEGMTITFDGSGSDDPDGVIVSYFWDFGDGQTSTERNPTHTYTQNDTYTVTLTVTDDDSATDTDTTTATVADINPTADFSAIPTSGSEPLTVSFTDLSTSYDGITVWQWDFGDGEASNEQNPTHVYNEGIYTVTLAIYEADGNWATETKADYITVSDAEPISDFMASPTSGLEPLTVSFTDTSTSFDGIISWNWSFGDGETRNEQNPIHTYTSAGQYTVSLTVSEADGNSNTETKFPYIVVDDSVPTAVFTYVPSNPIEGELVTFETSGSTGYDQPLSYSWDFGDSTSGSGVNPIHTYTHDGDYPVTLMVTDADGSTDSISLTITVADKDPIPDFNASTTGGPEPLQVDFEDTSTSYDGIVNWTWDFGDGEFSSEQNPTHTYAHYGIYTVSLTVQELDGDSDIEIKTDYITVKKRHYVTVISDQGSPTPSQWVEEGGSSTVSVTSPSVDDGSGARYRCTGYRIDDGTLASGTSYNFTEVDASHTITFEWIIQYSLTVNSVCGTPSGFGWYDEGSTAYVILDTGTVNGTTGNRYVFTQWSRDASGTDYTQSNAINMDEPKTVNANWKTQYYLTVETDPIGLNPQPIVSPTGLWYDNGMQVNLTAGLVEGYNFNHWDVDGTAQDFITNPTLLTMGASHTAIACYTTSAPALPLSWLGVIMIIIAAATVTFILARKRILRTKPSLKPSMKRTQTDK